ncbi:bifunctional diguanylate cyclase/phosphodiesterase [Campylobacter sp.]|uniref:bifunctional diguanylate cyclase/phosphodiesterase n=1 Tax=Campylobacter sp. TaxID=205 RepID=UPI0026FB056D|nr:EAL domain-containing protein [Campylobacter sp.]
MKNKIVFLKILFLFLALLVFVGGMMTYKTTNDVLKGYAWRNSISDLTRINKDINFILDKTFLQADHDRIMKLIVDFNENLKGILNTEKLKTTEAIPADKEIIERVKKTFSKKTALIDSFNSIAIHAKFLYDDIIFNDLYRSVYFDGIMPNILLFRYDTRTDLQRSKMLLDEYLKTEDLSANNINFLNSAKDLVEYYEEAQSILAKIDALNIRKELDELLIDNQKYIDKAITALKNMTRIFIILVACSIFVVYITYVRARNILKRLNHVQQAVDNIFSSIIFMDLNKNIKYVNKIFEEISGYKTEEVRGKNIQTLMHSAHLTNVYDEDITKTLNDNKIWRCDEFVSESKSGDLIYEQVMLAPLFDEKNKKDGYVLVKFDKTKEILTSKELEKKDIELRNKALHDRLTGFGSYFALTQRLNDHPSGMIIYININNFMDFRFFYKTKTIDLIIVSFSKTLQLCIDTYKIKASIYRVQFDEFCIWYDGDNIRRDIARIKDYFVANDLYILVEDKKEFIPNIKTTIGVSLMQDTVQTNRLTQAMLAHHEAKDKGEAVYYYTENSHIEQQYYQNQIMSRTIEYAIYNNTIIVECQGVYDISYGMKNPKIKYYEVLVRLIDESGKIRYPNEFLDIAKKISLYNDITKKVIGHVFRLVEKFPKLSFSMNLSNSDIVNSQIRDLLDQKLRICSYPEHVYFEILESEGVDDYEAVNSFIHKIRGYNSKIAIDDFGSGYSNYYRILELDIDTIKIDGSIVKKLPFDKNARYLMQTIIDFANRQNYNVVAEFVSSPEILSEIKKFGIKYGQGFLLGKPIPPDEIEKLENLNNTDR